LLSFEKLHSGCFQVAIDMLKRLNYPKQIIKVLLAKQKVAEALWYTKHFRYQVLINPENYLDISLNKNNVLEFFNCLSYFSKSHPQTSFQVYLDHYNKLFDSHPISF